MKKEKNWIMACKDQSMKKIMVKTSLQLILIRQK